MMADQDAAPAEQITDRLAAAEDAAAREAAEVAGAGSDEGGKVIRPKARTVGAARPRAAGRKKATDAQATDVTATDAVGAGEPDAVEIAQGGADVVRARSVSVTQGGITHATADEVTVRQGGIGRLEARDVAVSQGGIGFARAERVSVELGGIGAAFAGEASVTQGAVTTLVAREVRIGQSFVRSLVASDVRFDRPSGVGVLLARRVEGDVRVLIDWRGALVIGAIVGLLGALLRRRG
jgi:hypothetical protein